MREAYNGGPLGARWSLPAPLSLFLSPTGLNFCLALSDESANVIYIRWSVRCSVRCDNSTAASAICALRDPNNVRMARTLAPLACLLSENGNPPTMRGRLGMEAASLRLAPMRSKMTFD
jgi:hypothetical protein